MIPIYECASAWSWAVKRPGGMLLHPSCNNASDVSGPRTHFLALYPLNRPTCILAILSSIYNNNNPGSSSLNSLTCGWSYFTPLPQRQSGESSTEPTGKYTAVLFIPSTDRCIPYPSQGRIDAGCRRRSLRVVCKLAWCGRRGGMTRP